jgi:hypothetical protein
MTTRSHRGSGIGWIADSFEKTSQVKRYRDRWLTGQKWYELVYTHYFGKCTCDVDELVIKESAEKMKLSQPNHLIRSIGKKWASTLDDFTKTNQKGIFRHILHSATCPDTGTRRSVTFFHVTKPGKVIKKPQEGQTFIQDDHGTNVIRKRRQLHQTEEATTNPGEATTNRINCIESHQSRIQQLELLESRWHSLEYKKLFRAKNGESVAQCLDRQTALMAHANSNVNAWQDVIDTYNKELLCRAYQYARLTMNNAWRDVIDTYNKDGLCTKLHIQPLRQKCQLLGLAYQYERLTMNQFAEYSIQDAKF